jgi:hypothetical protein
MHVISMRNPRNQLAKKGQVLFGSKTYTCFRCKKEGRMMRDHDDTYKLVLGLGPGAKVPATWPRHPQDCSI